MSEAVAGQVSTNTRLDLHVAATYDLSRSAAQQRVAAGLVTVNARPVTRPGHRLQPTDVVELLPIPHRDPGHASDGPLVPLRVVVEDEWLAVIDKPAGLVVHPAPGHPTGTLADGLRQRGDTWSLAGGEERPGIVHRLDRFTSGLLVVAKTEAAHRALSAQLADRSLGRTYWTMVRGRLSEDTGSIEAPVGRDPRHRQRMAVVDTGRDAVTDFVVSERLEQFTVLEVSLRTGRTHQIRVHFASIGRPVFGDPVYGQDVTSQRPALHARRIRFVHPADGRAHEYESPLPEDLVELLDNARAGMVQ